MTSNAPAGSQQDGPERPRNQRDLAAAEARDRILAAAAECIVRDGLAKVRMAGIAPAFAAR